MLTACQYGPRSGLRSLQYAIRGEEDIPSDALARMAYYYPGKEADEIVSFFRSY